MKGCRWLVLFGSDSDVLSVQTVTWMRKRLLNDGLLHISRWSGTVPVCNIDIQNELVCTAKEESPIYTFYIAQWIKFLLFQNPVLYCTAEQIHVKDYLVFGTNETRVCNTKFPDQLIRCSWKCETFHYIKTFGCSYECGTRPYIL